MVTDIPDPYFERVPVIGELRLDYIILDYDYPLLFVCKDPQENLYICDCCDTYMEQRWVIAQITKQRLLDLLTNKITSRETFEKSEGLCYVVTWTKQDPIEKYTLLKASEFDPEDLPDRGAYLDAEEGEHDEYIEKLTGVCNS